MDVFDKFCVLKMMLLGAKYRCLGLFDCKYNLDICCIYDAGVEAHYNSEKGSANQIGRQLASA